MLQAKNEVFDAAGFDFISQPLVEVSQREVLVGLLEEYALEVTGFRARMLATEPKDFANFADAKVPAV